MWRNTLSMWTGHAVCEVFFENRKLINISKSLENFWKESIFLVKLQVFMCNCTKKVLLYRSFSRILPNFLEHLLRETLWLHLELLPKSVPNSLSRMNLIGTYRNQSNYLHCKLIDCKLTGLYIFLLKCTF